MPASSFSWLAESGFMPHGHCFLWTPSLLWLYVLSDLLIGAAYYSIPLALVYFVRNRRDLQFGWIFRLFSLFIFACGTTHLISIWTIWYPVYWLDASVKAATASISLVTAMLLWPLIPKALQLPSPAHLQSVITQMKKEVSERQLAETALAQLNETLELRVAARTAELEASNLKLAAEIEARKHAEKGFRRVVEFAPNAMVMTNRDGIIEMVNAQIEQIFDYAKSELLGKPIEILVPQRFRGHHPDLRTTFYAAPGSRPMGEGRDLYGVRKDGAEIPVEIALNPIETDEGIKVLAAIVDISDRKQKEASIRGALKEKETLLAEVHHRVKNNLQIVHSLLDLQSTQTTDPAVRAMLENSMNRIQSMALIHQVLYQSKDFARVALNDVLNTLASNIAMSFGATERRVKIAVDIAAIALPISQAIPCGLIVNELMTNALKHAFPDGRSGAIHVDLTLDSDDHVILSVSDNGIGLPPEIELDNTCTLGLELVSVLAEQMKGELTIQRFQPTRFAIRFALPRE